MTWSHFNRLGSATVALFIALFGCCVSAATVAPVPSPTKAPQAFAFFYGANPPWSELKAFDTVVVDPDHVADPKQQMSEQTRIAAYVSLGEVQTTRNYAARMPAAWLVGDNKAWGSRLIDQSAAEWPAFFVREVIAPLWERGYRDFFLDTLDSYQLFAKTPRERHRQELGMVAAITQLKKRFPEARLIFNRGFEILPRTHEHVSAVVAESLFQRYEAAKDSYSEVPEADRQWLLDQLQEVRSQWDIPIVVLDYVAAADRPLARQTAQKIAALGFTPWVSTGDLASMGLGTVEAMPRRILLVHSPVAEERDEAILTPVRNLPVPLNYLGYAPEFTDYTRLPEGTLAGRYAGITVWLTSRISGTDLAVLKRWLYRQRKDHVPIALMAASPELLRAIAGPDFGITLGFSTENHHPLVIAQQDPIMGFEHVMRPVADDFFPLQITAGKPLITLQQGDYQQVAAAITPWGGYAVGEYGIASLPGDVEGRWTVDPFSFFKAALQLPDMPVPDVTTESGRRMLLAHMDGDGFISRAEMPNAPIAGEVVRDQVVNRYPIPMTISIVEAEISPTGLYPSMSTLAEQVARDIFKAPHVAIASHSYSHPFFWSKVGKGDGGTDSYNLRIPGYKFSLDREISGSISYIQDRLAPPGKPVDIFLWTGDCMPVGDAVEMTIKANLLNMNGGDTVATRSSPTLTLVEGLGLPRKGGFQVFAPNQNENVYTNNWLGPFYGFERVIETFEFTESPRRIKPINIYFHTYIASKRSSLRSLQKVFDYALAQDVTPVHVAEYIRKVLDYQTLAIAKTPTGWRIRGDGQLRTFRLPQSLGWPDLDASSHVAGYRAVQDFSYLHMDAGAVDLRLSASRPTVPTLVSANAAIASYSNTVGQRRWILQGYVPLKLTLSNVQNCTVRFAEKDLLPVRQDGTLTYYEIPNYVAGPLDAICRT